MSKSFLSMLLFAACLTAQLPSGNEKGIAMGHLHILTKNMDAHRKLWVDTLGAKVVKAGPLELLQFPGVYVALRKGEPAGGTVGTVIDHLGFLVKDLDETKAKLTANGATVMREMPDTRQMFIEFPDGVKVEFTEKKDLDRPITHHHVHFATPQIDEMRAWYAKIFGAVPGMRSKFKAADLPGVNLTWNPADAPLLHSKGRSVDHIGFEVDNLEDFCKKLEAEGIKFDRPFTRAPQIGLNIAFLTDPWGVYIELTEGLDKL
jgi:catechol 2,3-dioxygenase-like lactoylglutathione lyase family enzyme